MLKLKDCILLINQIHVSVQMKLLFVILYFNIYADYCRADTIYTIVLGSGNNVRITHNRNCFPYENTGYKYSNQLISVCSR